MSLNICYVVIVKSYRTLYEKFIFDDIKLDKYELFIFLKRVLITNLNDSEFLANYASDDLKFHFGSEKMTERK